MKPQVFVGKKMFSLNVGNAARGAKQVLTPVVVSRVGRKYFTVQTDDKWRFETEYHLDTWAEKTEYTANSELYETEQDLLDEEESSSICLEIEQCFKYGINNKNIPLDSLRKIHSIIKGIQ